MGYFKAYFFSYTLFFHRVDKETDSYPEAEPNSNHEEHRGNGELEITFVSTLWLQPMGSLKLLEALWQSPNDWTSGHTELQC